MAATQHEDPRIADLERRLAEANKERDDLQRDVELLCMQNSGSMWSRSYVLTERFNSLEQELSKTKKEMARVTAERDSLREDIAQFRTSKRTADKSWKEERDKNVELEKELAFYQHQSAKVMSERDSAVYEAELMRSQNLKLDRSCREAEGAAELERTQRLELEKALDSCRIELQQFKLRAAEAAEVPELRARLEETLQQAKQLTAERNSFRESLKTTAAELDVVKRDLQRSQQDATRLKQLVQNLNKEIDQQQATIATQSQKVQELEGDLKAWQSAFSDMQASLAQSESTFNLKLTTLRGELETGLADLVRMASTLEQEKAALEAELRVVSKAKLNALSRLDDLSHMAEDPGAGTASESTAEALQRKVRALQVRLSGGEPEPAPEPPRPSTRSVPIARLIPARKAASGTNTPLSSTPETRSMFLLQPTTPTSRLMETSSVTSTPASGGDDDSDAEQAQAQVPFLQEVVASLERLANSIYKQRQALATAAKILWTAQGREADKALNELKSIDEECRALRAKVGVLAGANEDAGSRRGSQGGDGPALGPLARQGRRVEKAVAVELLDLVEFGVDVLRRYNRQRVLDML